MGAASVEAQVGIKDTDLVWQWPKEGVKGKSETHGEKEPAT